MPFDEQNRVAVAAEIAPTPQSDQSKQSRRGGKRPGAGRKPNLAKRLLKGLTRDTIALAAEDLDGKTVIIGLLKSRGDRTRLETLAFPSRAAGGFSFFVMESSGWTSSSVRAL